MSDQHPARAFDLHTLVASLPIHEFPVSRLAIPADGIYLLYETGERAPSGDTTIDRIVAAGAHTGEHRLARRLADHVSGDRRKSAVRQHVGAALLARANPADPQLAPWLADGRTPMPEAEAAVTTEIRERFTLRCIPVPDKDERLALERGIIALLAQHPIAPPSDTWLGRHAAPAEIRRTGLWNTQHINADPLTTKQWVRLESLIVTPDNAETGA